MLACSINTLCSFKRLRVAFTHPLHCYTLSQGPQCPWKRYPRLRCFPSFTFAASSVGFAFPSFNWKQVHQCSRGEVSYIGLFCSFLLFLSEASSALNCVWFCFLNAYMWSLSMWMAFFHLSLCTLWSQEAQLNLKAYNPVFGQCPEMFFFPISFPPSIFLKGLQSIFWSKSTCCLNGS